jgi:DNA topoisomerase VI subunit B
MNFTLTAFSLSYKYIWSFYPNTYQYKEKETVADIKKTRDELKRRLDDATDELINEMKERRDSNLKEMAENRNMLSKMIATGKDLNL